MSKVSFVTGMAGTGLNVYEVAERFGLFQTPALVVFTIITGFIFCLFGGITFVIVSKWVAKKIHRQVERYNRWMLK